jgi:prepilin-type N-terminal cleavage/methylation domain-containing protein
MAQPRSEMLSRRVGFSLLELVLVLVIVGTLAGVAAPRYANSISRYRADLAAQRVAADLHLARRHALISGADETVTFTPASEQYQIVGLQSMDRSTEDYVVDLSAGLYHAEIVSASFGGDGTVVFDAYGVPDDGGQIVVRAGHFEMTVVLDANSGKAQVQ